MVRYFVILEDDYLIASSYIYITCYNQFHVLKHLNVFYDLFKIDTATCCPQAIQEQHIQRQYIVHNTKKNLDYIIYFCTNEASCY